MSPEKSGGCVSSPLMMRTAAGEGHTDVDTARTDKQEEEALKSIKSATTTPPLRPAPRSAADGGPGSRPTLASRTRTATRTAALVCVQDVRPVRAVIGSVTFLKRLLITNAAVTAGSAQVRQISCPQHHLVAPQAFTGRSRRSDLPERIEIKTRPRSASHHTPASDGTALCRLRGELGLPPPA